MIEKPIFRTGIPEGMSRILGKVEDITRSGDGIHFSCRCAPFVEVGRLSGRYPWPDNLEPSKGFIFANRDYIFKRLKCEDNPETCARVYFFDDPARNITVRHFVSNYELDYAFDRDEMNTLVSYVVDKLAREYDQIMIRRVTRMNVEHFLRFNNILSAAGGELSLQANSIGERGMAHIDIPTDMLHHLHLDGDGTTNPTIPAKYDLPRVSKIETFNDRVVLVTFIDGTQTKCVCGKDETFDLYEGVAFCLFKRMLGKDGHKKFNDLMRKAMGVIDAQEEFKQKLAEVVARTKRHEEKLKKQRARRKAKKREEQIGIFTEALKRNQEDALRHPVQYSVPAPTWADSEPDVEPEKEG